MIKKMLKRWLDIPEKSEFVLSKNLNQQIIDNFAKMFKDGSFHYKDSLNVIEGMIKRNVDIMATKEISQIISSNLNSESILDNIVTRLNKKQLPK